MLNVSRLYIFLFLKLDIEAYVSGVTSRIVRPPSWILSGKVYLIEFYQIRFHQDLASVQARAIYDIPIPR